MSSLYKINLLFLTAYATLVIITYPFALLPPGLISLAFHISVPSLFVLTLFSLPVVFSASCRPRWLLTTCMGIYFFSLILNYLRFRSYGVETIQLLGYLIVPLAISMVYKQTDYITLKGVGKYSFYFWLFQTIYGFWSLGINDEVVGLAGNRNWMASLLLALTPWSYYHLKTIINTFIFRRVDAKESSFIRIFSALIIAIPTLYLMVHCASRGAWLALGVLVTFLAIRYVLKNFRYIAKFVFNMTRIEKFASAIVFVLSLVTVIAYLRLTIIYLSSPMAIQDLERLIKSDVRLPLWSSTLAMVRDNDVFLSLFTDGDASIDDAPEINPFGIGPGRYTKVFTDYRRRSTYHERLVAAAVSIHPHNEFLFIGAQLGILSAIAWFITLLPLVRTARFTDPLKECARISAFCIYFHSFFDMTLVQAPGNLVGLFCLGLCWQDYLTATASIPHKSYLAYFQKSIVSLTLITLVCGGTFVVVKDLRTDWYFRKGMINEKLGRYDESLKDYTLATTTDPQNIQPHIYTASLALDKLKNPALGLSVLLKAQAIDPDFGHINGQLGQALGQLGNHREALRYLLKECKLYPKDPKVFQNYFNGLVLKGDFNRLIVVSQYLKKIYCEKAELKYGKHDLTKQIDLWMHYVENDDSNAALAIAEDICMSINKKFTDPLFYIVTQEDTWPAEALSAQFNNLDYVYWRQLLLLKKLSWGTLGNSQYQVPDFDIVKRLHSFFNHHLVVDTSVTHFEFPRRVWKERKGNLSSCYFFFSQLVYQCGFLPLLCYDDKDDQPSYCLLLKDKQLYKLSLLNDSLDIERMDLEISGNNSKSGLDIRWKIGFLPQELWLRNQILGTVINRFGQGVLPKFDEIPILQICKVLQLRANSSRPNILDFKKFCLLEPTKAMLQKLAQ